MHRLTCGFCKDQFESSRGDAKYCKNLCYFERLRQVRAERSKKTCLFCGDIYIDKRPTSSRAKLISRFCSRKCSSLFNIKKKPSIVLKKTCTACEQPFEKKGVATTRFMHGADLRWSKQRYCSSSCARSASGHKVIGTPRETLENFLFRKVKKRKGDKCWIWEGNLSRGGYGVALKLGSNVITAHRLSYALAKGPIPKGHVIRHNCDIRSCVNPSHLIHGTQKMNMMDMVLRNRQATGFRHSRAKSLDFYRSIIKLISKGYTNYQIAKRFGYEIQLVRKLKNRTHFLYRK